MFRHLFDIKPQSFGACCSQLSEFSVIFSFVHSFQNSVCYFGKVKDSLLKSLTLALTLSISLCFPQVPACSGQPRTDHLYWALPGRGRGWICGDHQPHCPFLQVRGPGALGQAGKPGILRAG